MCNASFYYFIALYHIRIVLIHVHCSASLVMCKSELLSLTGPPSLNKG